MSVFGFSVWVPTRSNTVHQRVLLIFRTTLCQTRDVKKLFPPTSKRSINAQVHGPIWSACICHSSSMCLSWWANQDCHASHEPGCEWVCQYSCYSMLSPMRFGSKLLDHLCRFSYTFGNVCGTMKVETSFLQTQTLGK